MQSNCWNQHYNVKKKTNPKIITHVIHIKVQRLSTTISRTDYAHYNDSFFWHKTHKWCISAQKVARVRFWTWFSENNSVRETRAVTDLILHHVHRLFGVKVLITTITTRHVATVVLQLLQQLYFQLLFSLYFLGIKYKIRFKLGCN